MMHSTTMQGILATRRQRRMFDTRRYVNLQVDHEVASAILVLYLEPVCVHVEVVGAIYDHALGSAHTRCEFTSSYCRHYESSQ